VLQLKERSGFGEPRSATDSSAERGWSSYQRGDIDTAARELRDASGMPNPRPWVLYALGFAEFAQKRYADAAQSWELVRSGAPEFEPVYFNLADAHLQQHDDGAAIKVLREAEQRWPADAEVANAVGVIQIRRGALDAAIASFERAIGLAPGEGLGYFNLGRAHQLRAQKLQRYDRQLERWIGGEEDRRRAIAAFQKYVEIGGPFEGQAREAMTALGWIQQP
jgi:tetratricopeptide (TPR) repeat protein